MKSTHTRTSKPNNINLYGDAVKTVYFSIYQLQKSNVVKNKNRLSSNLRVLVSKWHIFCFLSNFFHSTPHIHTGETPRLDSSAFTNLHTAKARTIELWWHELVDFTAAEWRQDLLRDSGITMRLVHSLDQERTARMRLLEHALNQASQNHLDSSTTRAPRTNKLVYIQPDQRPEERITLGTAERWSTRYQQLDVRVRCRRQHTSGFNHVVFWL